MNKIDVLLDAAVEVIGHVHGIADSLQTVVDVFRENKPRGIGEAQPAKLTEPASAKPKNEKPYTLEDVRGILAEKSQSGYSSDVKTLIAKFGVGKLSEVDESKYADLVEMAEVIGNE